MPSDTATFRSTLGCKHRGPLLVAGLAEGNDVVEPTLASSLDDGLDVLGIPEGFSVTVESFGGKLSFEFIVLTVVVFELFFEGMAVTFTIQADPSIPLEYLLAQIDWAATELPFMDTDITAERPPASRYLLVAPAAEAPAVGAAFQILLGCESSLGVRTVEAHLGGKTLISHRRSFCSVVVPASVR